MSASVTRPLGTVEATLPSGSVVKLREPTGDDELKAQNDAGSGPNAATMLAWSQIMRATVAINGKELDQSTVTPRSFREMFSAKDMAHLRILFFETFYVGNEEEESRFRDSRKMGTT